MNRRSFLLSATAVAGAAALAGCATGSPVTPASVTADIVLIANSLAGVLGQVKGVVVPTAVTDALADLQAVAKAIGAADTVAAAQPLVLRVEADVNAVAGAVAAIPGPMQIWASDAVILLPVLESAVNLLVPASVGAGERTPYQARAELRAMVR